MIDCIAITNCKVSKNQKKETLTDKGAESKSKCLVENPSQLNYSIIEFEKCVFSKIQQSEKKCDLGLETENRMYFIELKGSNNTQGLRQLTNTIRLTKDCFYSLTKEDRPRKIKKELHAILIVSQKQVPRNIDLKTRRDLSLLIGKDPVVTKHHTITI